MRRFSIDIEHRVRRFIILAGALLLTAQLLGCASGRPVVQSPPSTQTEIAAPASDTPLSGALESRTRSVDEMTMILIPGGTFQMGSTEAEIEEAIALCHEHYDTCNRWYYERESPSHEVSLQGYWIDLTEVSNAQYGLCVEAGECSEPDTCQKGEPTYFDPGKATHPVVCVDWADADTYCSWVGARLPSEAEWEFAYRGESRSIFTWGNVFDGSKLNYCDENCSQTHFDERYDDGYSQTAPVGTYASGVSWSGIYNMSGNVSEWVNDWFAEYSAEDVSSPAGPSSGVKKMLKGCSWYFHPTYCRGAARPAVDPATRFDYLGFRCAATTLMED